MTDISIVICAYTEKRWEDLNAAVASVLKQTLAPFEIILVIDHNTALYERAKQTFTKQCANLKVVENVNTRGLSGARNTGIVESTGDIVAFIDEDAMAAPDWLARIAAAYADAEMMAVGGSIAPLWMTGKPSWFPDEFNWVVGCTYRGMPETRASIRNLIGCNMSIRRSVFDVVGGFRSGIGRVGTLPVGCEETELCIRARQQLPDYTIIYDPEIRVYNHRVPANRAKWRYFWSRCYAEGISKALVAQFVGQRDSLASELRYTLRTLPNGVLRGLANAMRGDISGLGRAFAIVSGLTLTVSGFTVGLISVLLKATSINTETFITKQSA